MQSPTFLTHTCINTMARFCIKDNTNALKWQKKKKKQFKVILLSVALCIPTVHNVRITRAPK